MNLTRLALYGLLAATMACAAGGCGNREKPVKVDAKTLQAALDGQELELEEENIKMAVDNVARFKVLDGTRVPDGLRVSVGVRFEYFDRGKTLDVDGTVCYEETTGGGVKDPYFETAEVKVQ